MKPGTKFWRIVLAAKLFLALVTVTAILCQFNNAQLWKAYANWPPGKRPALSSRFATWDIAHYLRLSRGGYVAGSPSCAFFPLWPGAIHTGTFLAGERPLVAALVLANVLSIAASGLFYWLVVKRYGPATGRDTLILLLAFPGALFFSFPYTESLYLTMVLLWFWGLESEAYFWPSVIGFLLPLARAVGVFVVVPLAWHLYERRKPWKHWLLLLAPLAGYASYFGLMYLWTGNAFEGFEAQKAYPYSPSVANMFHWRAFFHAFVGVGSLDGMMDSALDRGCFILFLALLPLIYRLNKTWFWYTLPTGLVPALTSYFMSYRRYLMVCFPVFVVLAQLLAKTKSRWIFWYYVAILTALQAWAVKQFVNFNWAG